MKNLKDCFLNEAKQLEYRVCLIGCTNPNNDNLPVNVSILVDQNDKDALVKYLEDEQDNLFSHAEGPGVEY